MRCGTRQVTLILLADSFAERSNWSHSINTLTLNLISLRPQPKHFIFSSIHNQVLKKISLVGSMISKNFCYNNESDKSVRWSSICGGSVFLETALEPFLKQANRRQTVWCSQSGLSRDCSENHGVHTNHSLPEQKIITIWYKIPLSILQPDSDNDYKS